MRALMSGDRTFHVVEAVIEPGGDVGGALRRRWPDEFKERAVAAALVPGVNVSAVARQMGVSPAQLFGWRREMRIVDPGPAVSFVPALVEAVNSEKVERSRPRSARTGRGDIELEFQGVVVRVRRGAEAKTVAAVIKALKATR